MALVDSLVVFVVSLLIGGIGIYVAARVVVDESDYGYAVVTALIGAIVWGIVGFFLGWIPLLGPLLTFLAYIGVINARYPGGFWDAVVISLVAWLASAIVLYLLAALGFVTFQAVGVPGA